MQGRWAHWCPLCVHPAMLIVEWDDREKELNISGNVTGLLHLPCKARRDRQWIGRLKWTQLHHGIPSQPTCVMPRPKDADHPRSIRTPKRLMARWHPRMAKPESSRFILA